MLRPAACRFPAVEPDLASELAAASGITWDLSDLYAAPDDPRLRIDLDGAVEAARLFAERYRAKISVNGGPSAELIAEIVTRMEVILAQVAKAAIYADLLHAADAAPAAHGALVALTQEKTSLVRQQVVFFELEWLAVGDEAAERVIDAPRCRRHRHFLRSLRRYKPHVLSEPEEKILEDKANTGARAFARLFDEVTSALLFDVDVAGTAQRLNETGVLALLYDSRRDVRQAAAAAFTRGLEANQLLLGFIFNTLVQDHAIDDRLRTYGDPMAARHLANEISAETVRALMAACEGRHDLVRRYYHLKGRLLGIKTLADYDRYAPVIAERSITPWA